MKRIAVYPGTFDPITHGHVDLIHRASKLFDTIIVAVANNTRKSTLLSISQRITLVTEVLSNNCAVIVEECPGIVVEFAKRHQASAIIRGLRTAADYENEFQLAGMNLQMAPEITSIFLPASHDYAYISATLVRELIALGGDISKFVPETVLLRLKEWGVSNFR